jgi:hypothetical protein
MSPRSRQEMLKAIYPRYRQASRGQKTTILNEFCAATGYHRKYAIQLLSRPPDPEQRGQRRGRRPKYSSEVVRILIAIWEAAGYPWSVRLKAALPLWLPYAKQRLAISPVLEEQLLSMSPRTMDRRLRAHKKRLGRRLYGRTKPGSLLKHQIPIQTSAWKTDEPGFGEIDLVSHSGSAADGEFVHSLNFTDIASTWTEARAVMGKGRGGVHRAIEAISEAQPFRLRGLDSDNGSEFINHHLVAFCQQHQVQFTRSRPYKKDDNAHIEQKNWTHVRKLLGWERYDTHEALEAINDLYTNELRLWMNLFQPSVKLVKKVRVGSRLRRVYDTPKTPLDRLLALGAGDEKRLEELKKLREELDPFELSATIERQLEEIYRLANRRQSPSSGDSVAA